MIVRDFSSSDGIRAYRDCTHWIRIRGAQPCDVYRCGVMLPRKYAHLCRHDSNMHGAAVLVPQAPVESHVHDTALIFFGEEIDTAPLASFVFRSTEDQRIVGRGFRRECGHACLSIQRT